MSYHFEHIYTPDNIWLGLWDLNKNMVAWFVHHAIMRLEAFVFAFGSAFEGFSTLLAAILDAATAATVAGAGPTFWAA